jgi:hypothetical protein
LAKQGANAASLPSLEFLTVFLHIWSNVSIIFDTYSALFSLNDIALRTPMKRMPVLAAAIVLVLSSCQPEQPESPTKGVLVLHVPESIAPAMKVQIAEFLKIYSKNGEHIRTRYRPLGIPYSTADGTGTRPCEEHRGRPYRIDRRVRRHRRGRPLQESNRPFATGRDAGHPYGKGFALGEALSSEVDAGTDHNDLPGFFRRHSVPGRPVANPGAIAFVGLDWLDSAKVPAKALELSQTEQEADTTYQPPVESFGKFYGPHPAHIHRSYYPLKRSIIMYSKSIRGDVAAGFGTWVANKEGQKLFLARRIVPATQPIRLK